MHSSQAKALDKLSLSAVRNDSRTQHLDARRRHVTQKKNVVKHRRIAPKVEQHTATSIRNTDSIAIFANHKACSNVACALQNDESTQCVCERRRHGTQNRNAQKYRINATKQNSAWRWRVCAFLCSAKRRKHAKFGHTASYRKEH